MNCNDQQPLDYVEGLLTRLCNDFRNQFPYRTAPAPGINATVDVHPDWVYYLADLLVEEHGLVPSAMLISLVIMLAVGSTWYMTMSQVTHHLVAHRTLMEARKERTRRPTRMPRGYQSDLRRADSRGFRYAGGPATGGPGYAPPAGYGAPGAYIAAEPLYRNPVDPYEPLPVGATPKEAMDWMGRVTGRKLAEDMRRPGHWHGMGSGTFEGTYGGGQPGYSTNEDLDRIHDPSNQRTSPGAFEARLKAQRAFMAETNPCDVLAHDEEFQNLWATLYSHGVQVIAHAGSSSLEAAWDELNTARTQFEAARNDWAVERNNQEAENGRRTQPDEENQALRFVREINDLVRRATAGPSGIRIIPTTPLAFMSRVKWTHKSDVTKVLWEHFDELVEGSLMSIMVPSLQYGEQLVSQEAAREAVVMVHLEGKKHMFFLASEGGRMKLIHFMDGARMLNGWDALLVAKDIILAKYSAVEGQSTDGAMPSREAERKIEDQVITAIIPAGEDTVKTYERLMGILRQAMDSGDYQIASHSLSDLGLKEGVDLKDPWAVTTALDERFGEIVGEYRLMVIMSDAGASDDIVLFPLDGKRHMLFLATEHTDEVFPRLRHLIDGGELNLSEDELMVEAWGSMYGIVHTFTSGEGIKVQAPEDKPVPTKEDERVCRYTKIVDRLEDLADTLLGPEGNLQRLVIPTTLQQLLGADAPLLKNNGRHEIAGWLSTHQWVPAGGEPVVYLIRDTRNGIPFVVVVPPDEERNTRMFGGWSVLYMDGEGDIKKYTGMFSLPPGDLLERLEKLLQGELPETADQARQRLSLTHRVEK